MRACQQTWYTATCYDDIWVVGAELRLRPLQRLLEKRHGPVVLPSGPMQARLLIMVSVR